MTCEGCKWHKHRAGRIAWCEKFNIRPPEVRCIDFRRKQGQRAKA